MTGNFRLARQAEEERWQWDELILWVALNCGRPLGLALDWCEFSEVGVVCLQILLPVLHSKHWYHPRSFYKYSFSLTSLDLDWNLLGKLWSPLHSESLLPLMARMTTLEFWSAQSSCLSAIFSHERTFLLVSFAFNAPASDSLLNCRW